MAVSLVGIQLLGFVLIDALKYAGVVNPGDSGKWSAAYNLIVLIGVVAWLGFAPSFDLAGLDAQIYELAKTAAHAWRCRNICNDVYTDIPPSMGVGCREIL